MSQSFPGSKIKNMAVLNDTPSGSVDVVTFELIGREFQAISAGPDFQVQPVGFIPGHL